MNALFFTAKMHHVKKLGRLAHHGVIRHYPSLNSTTPSIPLTTSHRLFTTSRIVQAATTVTTRPFKPIKDAEVDTESETYKQNAAASSDLFDKYHMFLNLIKDGGGEKSRLRHTESNKKVLVADRLKMLFDDADDVLEIGAFTGLGMKYGNVPRAGLVIGEKGC